MVQSMKVRCCIVGGGPAGMMLGYLLGRAGVDVVVLEKHADFFRDFRGDTVHPSTLDIMDELGLLNRFLKLPHQKVEKLTGLVGDTPVAIGELAKQPRVSQVCTGRSIGLPSSTWILAPAGRLRPSGSWISTTGARVSPGTRMLTSTIS